jgi:hypothetical protein
VKSILSIAFAVLVLFLCATAASAASRDLPEIPPPPPRNMATVQDIAGLKAEIAELQNQVLDLMEAVNKQSVALGKTREVLLAVSKAESFAEAKTILNSKYGVNKGTIAALQGQNATMMSAAQARIGQVQGVRPQFKANLRSHR